MYFFEIKKMRFFSFKKKLVTYLFWNNYHGKNKSDSNSKRITIEVVQVYMES